MARHEDANVGQLTIAGADDKGTTIKQYREITASVTPVAVATIVAVEQALTFPGVKVGDKVLWVSAPTAQYAQAVGLIGGRVTAADTVAVKFVNPTAGSLTPTAGSYTVAFIRT